MHWKCLPLAQGHPDNPVVDCNNTVVWRGGVLNGPTDHCPARSWPRPNALQLKGPLTRMSQPIAHV